MANKKVSKENLSVYKRDTNGLFNGGFKADQFETKEERENRKRHSTDYWLEYMEEEELENDE